jgi:hypothetical protein
MDLIPVDIRNSPSNAIIISPAMQQHHCIVIA